MKKIITFQFLLFVSISIFGNTICDSTPGIVKRISPNISNSFSNTDATTKTTITCCRCYMPSMTQGTEPLLIVDGVPFEFKELRNIDPNNIKSLDILKASYATALFGCRASNGVVIITTRYSLLRRFNIKDFLDGNRISGATISFISADKKDTLIYVANDSGIVITDKLRVGLEYEIKTSAVGYKDLRLSFRNSSVNKENNIQMERNVKDCKEVIIVNYPTIKCRMPICCGYLISSESNKNDVLNNKKVSFSIFPNPVKTGTSLNIEWKQSETGEYILQIFNNAGQLTFNKEMWIDDEATVLNFEVPHVAAGNYFLRMTNKNSGKAFTEKIIIQ